LVGELVGKFLVRDFWFLVRSPLFVISSGVPVGGVVDEEICGKRRDWDETGCLVAPDCHRRTTQLKLR
jgi:hypothetical protein